MDPLLLVFLMAALLLEGRAQWERRRLKRVGEMLLQECLRILYATNSRLYKQEPFRIYQEKRYFQSFRRHPHGKLHLIVSASVPRDLDWLTEMARGISLEFVEQEAPHNIYITIHPMRRDNALKSSS